jgi:hypothetical protein
MEGLLSKNAMRADVVRTITLARLRHYHFLAILLEVSRFIFFRMQRPAHIRACSAPSYLSILSFRAKGVAANALSRRLG